MQSMVTMIVKLLSVGNIDTLPAIGVVGRIIVFYFITEYSSWKHGQVCFGEVEAEGECVFT